MKTLRIILSIAFCALLSTAFAQQPAAPASAASDNGAQLAAAMQLVQDALNGQGRISYTLHTHDSSNNSDWPIYHITIEFTNVIADPASCRITWHKTTTNDGKVGIDRDFSLDLRTVMSFETRTSTQEAKAEDNANGLNELTKIQDPPYFVVTASSQGNTETPFFLKDEETRDNVAKALIRAMVLCGGGR